MGLSGFLSYLRRLASRLKLMATGKWSNEQPKLISCCAFNLCSLDAGVHVSSQLLSPDGQLTEDKKLSGNICKLNV
jgi:hypothetical protein